MGWIADELGYMEKYRHYLFQLARAPLPWEIKRYNRLSSMENVRTLFMDMGTDAKKIYEAAVKSAKARIEITEALARQLKITSTPAFLVRGKYLVQGMRSKPFAEFMMADLIFTSCDKAMKIRLRNTAWIMLCLTVAAMAYIL
ncbi:hypothetical protein ACFS3C_04300 [Azotobacter vinelandii]